ncbi:MAG: hypothetical protein M1824_002582 [Vezdaea acicularis]|nr:MAG: hypothetical protein M1824_002582 [Vezdaea acicularis]
MLPSTLLTLLTLPLLSLATTLTLLLPPTTLLPNPSTLPPSTFALLQTSGQAIHAPLSRANTFLFRNLTAGSYLLDIICKDYTFQPYRVDITLSTSASTSASDTIEVYQLIHAQGWDAKGPKLPPLSGFSAGNSVFEVQPLATKDYYEARPGFSPLDLLKNPMMLMAGASLLIVFGMPYLMENMGEEMKEELAAQQKKSPLAAARGNQNPLQGFDMAAWMAGSTTKSASASGSGSGSGSAANDAASGSGREKGEGRKRR